MVESYFKKVNNAAFQSGMADKLRKRGEIKFW